MNLNACLTLDAWSNIKNKPIVNYMLISDSSTFFLESVLTDERSSRCQMDSPGYGKKRLILLSARLVGAVTDNTTTNRSAWSILKKKYPDLFLPRWKLKLQKAQLTENPSGLVQPAPTR
ncbi:hypothetical protein BASA62_000872 [Batrachochytrium salamandrivorans]|nr:hypothetical protein BASA62_000872 [Batrachochytrium salamandrivorans]